MLSATAHDILYYMSPIYCQDIINSLSNQLNRLYLKFLKRNPCYDGKVSLYGHSLGSVLSYDILCHQENLSSPFPMDRMYKEQNEESSPIMNSQSSECNFTSCQDKNFSVNNETMGMEVPIKEDNMSEQLKTSPVLEKEQEEDSSVPVGFSVTLDLDEHSLRAMDPKQQVSDCSSMLSCKGEDFSEASSMNCAVPVADSGKLSEGVSESDKEKEIKLLKEEIDSLKARNTELESQCGAKGNEAVAKTFINEPISGKFPPGQNDTSKIYTPCIKYTKLEFKVDTFFAVGSPLGVFLALRNIRIGIGKGQEYWEQQNICEEMPACRQMFNIFHPFDPVAYRIEPLVCKEYISKRPVIIPYHKGGKRLHIGLQEFAEDLVLRSQAVTDQLNSVKVKMLTLCQSRNKDSLDEVSEDTQEKEERSYGSIMMERLTGSEDGRIDHVLQDKTFQHPYISAIGSHTNYWRDYDTALFILKHLYRDIAEETELLEETKDGSSKYESDSDGSSEQREAVEEELPLTFADKVLIKNFSRKAKNIMKRR